MPARHVLFPRSRDACRCAQESLQKHLIYQSSVHVDDLIEPGAEHIVLPAVPALPRPHGITSALLRQLTESCLRQQCNLQENRRRSCEILQMKIAKKDGKLSLFRGL